MADLVIGAEIDSSSRDPQKHTKSQPCFDTAVQVITFRSPTPRIWMMPRRNGIHLLRTEVSTGSWGSHDDVG